MEKQYVRVLSIRNHKTISFINGYNNLLGNIQYMISNELCSQINCGDLIECDIIDTINKKGQKIKRIDNIYNVIPCYEFQSYKGINDETIDEKEKAYLNARNCGTQLKLLTYKKDVIAKIKEVLNALNYFDSTGLLNAVEYYPNGSNIKEAIIQDRDKREPKYLRVTLENQLKQLAATLLTSTYAIEKVFRNMGEDHSHINEFLMLELVSLDNDMNKMLEFIKKIDLISKELGDKHEIIVPDKELEIIDYNDLPKGKFDEVKKDFINTVIINFPCESPFILKNDLGERTEVRWYISGRWISHYYQDENRYENVKEVLDFQRKNSDKEIDELNYIKWGLPSSVSLGLSIDRWLQVLLNIPNLNTMANPIALDYPKKVRKR